MKKDILDKVGEALDMTFANGIPVLEINVKEETVTYISTVSRVCKVPIDEFIEKVRHKFGSAQ